MCAVSQLSLPLNFFLLRYFTVDSIRLECSTLLRLFFRSCASPLPSRGGFSCGQAAKHNRSVMYRRTAIVLQNLVQNYFDL